MFLLLFRLSLLSLLVSLCTSQNCSITTSVSCLPCGKDFACTAMNCYAQSLPGCTLPPNALNWGCCPIGVCTIFGEGTPCTYTAPGSCTTCTNCKASCSTKCNGDFEFSCTDYYDDLQSTCNCTSGGIPLWALFIILVSVCVLICIVTAAVVVCYRRKTAFYTSIPSQGPYVAQNSNYVVVSTTS